MPHPMAASPTETPPLPVALLSAESTIAPDPVVPQSTRRMEHNALGVGALLATLAIIWVARPVGIGILLGTLTAFTLQPLYRSLRVRFQRSVLAALICVGGTLLTLLLCLFGLGYLLVGRGMVLISQLVTALQPKGSLHVFLERMGSRLSHWGFHPQSLADRLGDAFAAISGRLAGVATAVAGTTFESLLTVFFLLLSMYFVLQNWTVLARRAEIMLPLRPRDTRALFDEFRRVGRTVLLGTVLTGLAQGFLATIGYLLTRVPEAPLFGALTTVASLVPGVGTLLIWIPVGLYLIFTGHFGLGIAELVYGAVVVVGFSDYFLRPRLVNEQGKAPALLTFTALFGGLEVFGLIGLILGPVIMSLAVALLRIYEREAAIQRAAEIGPAA